MVSESISNCDIDIRKEMINNICLSGGTTLLPGLPERLETELN